MEMASVDSMKPNSNYNTPKEDNCFLLEESKQNGIENINSMKGDCMSCFEIRPPPSAPPRPVTVGTKKVVKKPVDYEGLNEDYDAENEPIVEKTVKTKSTSVRPATATRNPNVKEPAEVPSTKGQSVPKNRPATAVRKVVRKKKTVVPPIQNNEVEDYEAIRNEEEDYSPPQVTKKNPNQHVKRNLKQEEEDALLEEETIKQPRPKKVIKVVKKRKEQDIQENIEDNVITNKRPNSITQNKKQANPPRSYEDYAMEEEEIEHPKRVIRNQDTQVNYNRSSVYQDGPRIKKVNQPIEEINEEEEAPLVNTKKNGLVPRKSKVTPEPIGVEREGSKKVLIKAKAKINQNLTQNDNDEDKTKIGQIFLGNVGQKIDLDNPQEIIKTKQSCQIYLRVRKITMTEK